MDARLLVDRPPHRTHARLHRRRPRRCPTVSIRRRMTDLAPDWQRPPGRRSPGRSSARRAGLRTARRPAIARFRDARPAAVVRCATPATSRRRSPSPAARGCRRGAVAAATASRATRRRTGSCSTSGRWTAWPSRGGVATIGAGARLGAVYDALDAGRPHDPRGCGPRVGVAGLTLGGGLGILGRSHGLLADSLVGARVVLADGRVVDCDAEREADLFWALRGRGRRRFGVVTAFRFATCPRRPRRALKAAGRPPRRPRVSPRGSVRSPDAPDAARREPPRRRPGRRGRAARGHRGGRVPRARGRGGAAPRRPRAAQRAPASTVPVHASFRARSGRSPTPPASPTRSSATTSRAAPEFFAAPIPAGRDRRARSPTSRATAAPARRASRLRPVRRRLHARRADATAFFHRDGASCSSTRSPSTSTRAPRRRAAARAWLEAPVRDRPPATGTGGVYPNFPEEGLEDWPRAYYGANLERLVAIKERYDPDDVFRAEQSIRPRARVGGRR